MLPVFLPPCIMFCNTMLPGAMVVAAAAAGAARVIDDGVTAVAVVAGAEMK
jgi:hypothetical protein